MAHKKMDAQLIIPPVTWPLRRSLSHVDNAAQCARGILSKMTDLFGRVQDLKIKVEYESHSVYLLIRVRAGIVLVFIIGIEFNVLAEGE